MGIFAGDIVVNAAIIGLGWWGKNIVKAVQGKCTQLRFVRGVTKEIEETQEFASEHGIPLSSELDEVLADPRIAAVVLATPHSLHADQIVAAARAGKHVFCEKPLSLKRADAERAVKACLDAKRVLGVGQNQRFWPAMTALRGVVASGDLGEVMHIEGHYSNENSSNFFAGWRDKPAETPGAGMTGTGIHILDAFVSMAGPVAEVSARFASMRGGHDPRDTISVLFRFKNGMSGTLGAVRPSPFYWRVHAFGDKGSAEALGETELVVRRSGKTIERTVHPAIDSLRAEFDAFAQAVAGGAPYPITPAEMTATIAAFEGIIESIASGKPVEIS
ncbi:MAG: Gfo/Idh/MocA family oxidoreductase [Proteobacteria bacterium]|nr:Gfo/Idh/MocA family oxidoreductase [Pseudomonadota bacterium]